MFAPAHLGLYTYVLNNPLIYIDPDGNAEGFNPNGSVNLPAGGVPFFATTSALALGPERAANVNLGTNLILPAAAAPMIPAAAGFSAVAVAGAAVTAPVVAGTLAKNADKTADVINILTALSGAPAPLPEGTNATNPKSTTQIELPSGSPIDPKTSVEQVSKNSNQLKPSKGSFAKMLPLLAPTMLSLESPKPPAEPSKPSAPAKESN